jgi:hypothetical protein
VRLDLELRDDGRLDEVHDDPRPPRREEAVPEGRDQALAPAPGLGREVEGHLRQVDDDAVGPLHELGRRRDGLRQGHGEAGPGALARHLDRGGERRSGLGFP